MSNYSGTTNVRLGAALHAHLAERADQQGVSLNQLIVTLLAGGSNFKLPKEDDGYMPALFIWGNETHTHQVMQRLGKFESTHLRLELQKGETAIRERIKAALEAGVIEVERPGKGPVPPIYRWVGPPR